MDVMRRKESVRGFEGLGDKLHWILGTKTISLRLRKINLIINIYFNWQLFSTEILPKMLSIPLFIVIQQVRVCVRFRYFKLFYLRKNIENRLYLVDRTVIKILQCSGSQEIHNLPLVCNHVPYSGMYDIIRNNTRKIPEFIR